MKKSCRKLLTIGALVMTLGTAWVASPAPSFAGHGFGYANCPTDLDLRISPTRVLYRNAIGITGRLERDDQADVSGQQIVIRRRPVGSSRVFFVGSATTDTNGEFSWRTTPTQTADYWATWSGNEACPSLRSEEVPVQVRARVTIQTTHVAPPAGYTWAIHGVVRPNHPGQAVTIEYRPRGARTSRTVTVPLNSRSEYFQRFRSNSPGTVYQIRTIYPKQHADHLGNSTVFIEVRIR